MGGERRKGEKERRRKHGREGMTRPLRDRVREGRREGVGVSMEIWEGDGSETEFKGRSHFKKENRLKGSRGRRKRKMREKEIRNKLNKHKT